MKSKTISTIGTPSVTFQDARRILRAIRFRVQKQFTFSNELETYLRTYAASTIRGLEKKYELSQEYVKALEDRTNLTDLLVMMVEYGAVVNFLNNSHSNYNVAVKVRQAMNGWQSLEDKIIQILKTIPVKVKSVNTVPSGDECFRNTGTLRATIVTMALVSSHPSRVYKDFYEGNDFYSIFRNMVPD